MTRILVCVLCAFVLAAFETPLPTQSQAGEWELERGQTGVVTHVIDGDTVKLDTGMEVRLIGLQAPKLPLGRRGFPTWPMAPEAKEHLEDLVLNRTVVLGFGGERQDRYGRTLAQVFRADGLWVQGTMIEDGMARVYSFADNRACVRALQAKEEEARSDRTGIWALPYYQIRGVEDLLPDVDSYQVIEGVVQSVADVRGRLFLNFGADWKQDFTVTVAARDAKRFDGAGFDVLGLEGRNIRVRGWLTEFNGPNLEVTHPEQIEILGLSALSDPATISPCNFASLVEE